LHFRKFSLKSADSQSARMTSGSALFSFLKSADIKSYKDDRFTSY